MRIAIVNDMLMAVEALRRALAAAPEYQIAWIARDGAEAVEKCAKDTPDVILMDLLMPVMDGVEATRRIMEKTPCAILVVTATVHGNAPKVFEAMGCGALDAVNTPVLGMDGQAEGGRDLLAKIATIGRLIGRRAAPARAPERTPPPRAAQGPVPPLIAIGASTGGPKALATILASFPATTEAAVVIVQHVNEQFAGGLVEWLGAQTRLRVQLAREGHSIAPGVAVVAGTNDHLVVTPSRTLSYTPLPAENPYRPSADVFFSSVANHWPSASAAALLTGMGKDGAQGLLRLRRAGWHTIVQDEASCVIYGMPKAAVDLGAAVEILPIEKIGPALLRFVEKDLVAQRKPK